MHTAITIVCNPQAPSLDDRLSNAIADAARPFGLCDMRSRWLSPGAALDLIFTGRPADFRTLSAAAREALQGAPADVIAQPAENRARRLLIADMDSTIIGQECIDELAEFAGRRVEIALITERTMRGELDFEAALVERVAMLKGLPEAILAQTFERRIRLNPGARALVLTMKARGAATALVSGGFTYFTSRVAEAAGFDHHEANALVVENGTLTGEVARPIRGRDAKTQALDRIVRERNILLALTLAVGDGANDLGMLRRAGYGVAYRAKPAVAAAADARIDHGDLTALLYMQGVPQTEFCAE
jgi:phosphoserine phosphatase